MQTKATDGCNGHQPVLSTEPEKPKAHDPLAIKGYLVLSEAQIQLMNEVKAAGEVLRVLTLKVEESIGKQITSQADMSQEQAAEAVQALRDADPYRWLESGTLDLQRGLMSVTRAIAQPAFF